MEARAADMSSRLRDLARRGGLLALVGNQARRGLLPRTRPILPGELAMVASAINPEQMGERVLDVVTERFPRVGAASQTTFAGAAHRHSL